MGDDALSPFFFGEMRYHLQIYLAVSGALWGIMLHLNLLLISSFIPESSTAIQKTFVVRWEMLLKKLTMPFD